MESTLQIPSSTIKSQELKIPVFRKVVLHDFLQMSIIFIGSVFAVYYAPSIVNYLYFLVMLGLFWRSKKDYFWFAFFFILINTPANLFFETSAGAARRLPLYNFLPGLSLSVFDAFILVSLAKIFYYKRTIGKRFTVNRSVRFLLFYVCLISFPITFIIGFNETGSSFFNTFRPYFYYTIVISFFFLIDKTEDIYKFGYLTVPYILVTLGDQLYLLMTGNLIASHINPATVREVVENTITGGARAYFAGYLLLFYAFLFGLQLRMNRKYEIINGFGYAIMMLSLLAFILSATRSYLMMPLVALFGYVLYSKRAAPDLIKLALVSVIFAVIFFSLNLISWESFMKGIWPRFEAFFNVIFGGGDIRKFDTVSSRLESDWPSLWNSIKFSPLVGAGFSGWFRKYENNDLGFLNTVLMLGWVGFIFFISFIVLFLKEINKWASDKYADQDSRVILSSIAIIFFGVLVGYATTYDFFTVRQIDRIYFIAVLMGSADVATHNIKKRKEYFLKQKLFKS